jgi:hypothetical protein
MILDTIYNLHLQLAFTDDHLIALLHPCNGIVYQLVNHRFRRFLLVDDCGSFSRR